MNTVGTTSAIAEWFFHTTKAEEECHLEVCGYNASLLLSTLLELNYSPNA